MDKMNDNVLDDLQIKGSDSTRRDLLTTWIYLKKIIQSLLIMIIMSYCQISFGQTIELSPLPPPPIKQQFEIDLENEIDSLHSNREQMMRIISEDLKCKCFPNRLKKGIIQMTIDNFGTVLNFKIIRPNYENLLPEEYKCVDHFLNHSDITFGKLKSKDWGARQFNVSKLIHTLPF